MEKVEKNIQMKSPNKSVVIIDGAMHWTHVCPYGKFEIQLHEDETCECGDSLSKADKDTIQRLMEM